MQYWRDYYAILLITKAPCGKKQEGKVKLYPIMRKNIKAEPKVDEKSKVAFLVSIFNEDNIAILFISLYLLVDFIPQLNSIEVMGPQWFYLSILNGIVSSYILLNFRTRLISVLKDFSGNVLTLCYIGLFLVSGMSIFFAINRIESLVVYARFIITIMAFFNIAILIHDRLKSVKHLCQIISIILLIQCVPLLISFLQGMRSIPIDTLILSLKGNSGNKNIMAASLIIKLPFLMYCVFNFSTLWRNLFNISILILLVVLIFILNARSAYVALFAQAFIYLVFCIKYNYRKIGILKTGYSCSKVILPIIVSFIISQVLFNNLENSKAPSNYGSVTSRLSTITNSNYSSNIARLFFWGNALDYIKSHPIIGCGYGNWKLASVFYEKEYNDNFDYSKHVHNDFLEVTAESGVLAGILFIALFVCAFMYTIKTWYSNASDNVKIIGVFSFISLVGYLVDALFNFPGERPIMGIFFVFALVINVTVFMTNRKSNPEIQTKSLYKTIPLLIVFLLIISSIYITYSTYRSMRVQWFTNNDFSNPNSDITWQQVNSKFPLIPNLAENNVPIDVEKAWYLFKGKKYEDALFLLNQSTAVNPYSMANEWLKAGVFYSMNRIDSAYYYSKKGFWNRPRSIGLYSILSRTSALMNDTKTVKSSFKEFNRYRNEPDAWKIYIRSLFAVNYNQEEVVSLADSIARVYPDDKQIQQSKFFVHAGFAAVNKDFANALENLKEIFKIYPNDYENIENIGLTYYYLKDYNNAVIFFSKVVQSKTFANGKSEFYLGVCLLETGKKSEACGYLSIAASDNFPQALETMRANCK